MYPGGSAVKETTRQLLHNHIHEITKPPGVVLFLAGSNGLDIPVARSLGMSDSELVGAEIDMKAYRQVVRLYPTIPIYHEHVGAIACRLWAQHVRIRSAILDYCGCWTPSNAATTKQVVQCLDIGSHFSVTFCRGHRNFDLESVIDSIKSWRPITHTQTIIYQSKRETDGSFGSPMITASFLVGKKRYVPTTIDLRTGVDMTTAAAKKAWKTRNANAEKRTNAALKAWKTRRKNEKKKKK